MKIKSRGNKQSELFSRPIIQLDRLRACEKLRFGITLYLSRITFENIVVRSNNYNNDIDGVERAYNKT